MKEKQVLFIDDGDITNQIGKLRKILRKGGITLVDQLMDVNDSKYRKPDEENPDKTILNFDSIKLHLEANYMDARIDYVMCDYDFADEKLDGFELIKWLKNVCDSQKKKLRIAKFSLYSSEPEKLLKRKNMTEKDISKLIKLRLKDFYTRERIAEDFGTDILNSTEELNLKDKMVSELVKHKGKKFQSVYPKFKGKMLDEIASEIENDTTHGRSFQENIVELTIAHLIDLNK